MASGSSGNFQSIPALKPDQVPIPTTAGSVNMYMNLDDNLNIWTVDRFKVHRPITPASQDLWLLAGTFNYTDWQPNAGGVGSIPIVSLLGTEYISAIFVKINTKFDDSVQAEINFAGSTTPLLPITTTPPNITVGGTPSIQVYINSLQSNTTGIPYTLDGILTVYGNPINSLTQGSLEIWYKKSTIPS